MKITFILPYAGLTGGIRVIAIYAEQLRQRGHEVFVVSQPRSPLSWRQRLRAWFQGQSSQLRDRSSHFDGCQVSHTVLERRRPVTDADLPDADIVIATWWETAEWVNQLAPSKGRKFYLIQHHEIHPYLPVERVAATYRLPLHKIVIAQWLKTVMADCYGDSQVALVPNGVDRELFQAPPRTKQPRPTIGFIYSTIHWKGTDIAIEALNLARATLPELQIVAFGAEPITDSLPLPAQTTYRFKPPQAEIKTLYAQCDAWLFSSRLEGFGLPLLEAMACRTPVIATPAGAAPELVGQGGGILVKADSPQAMAEAILQIAQLTESQWQTLSDLAHQTAIAYGWEEATVLLESTLQNAIATPS
jgi:glycosyltransferase involved in cell wall biosynthesis